MFEIAPHLRPPLATLLAFTLPVLAGAAILLLRAPRWLRRRLMVTAAAGGILLTGMSGAVSTRRHAGTGTETALGWPRIVYSRWESFEGQGGRSGVHWRGILEGTIAYGAVAAALLGARTVARHRRLGRDDSARQAPT